MLAQAKYSINDMLANNEFITSEKEEYANMKISEVKCRTCKHHEIIADPDLPSGIVLRVKCNNREVIKKGVVDFDLKNCPYFSEGNTKGNKHLGC